MAEIDKETVRIQGELQAEGVTALPAYVQAPLELDARCTSPKMTRYLELLLKADRLFTMLEALRLAGAITSESYDHRCAVIIARLVDVPRRALNTVVGLRKHAHRMAARAAPPTVPRRHAGSRPVRVRHSARDRRDRGAGGRQRRRDLSRRATVSRRVARAVRRRQ